MTPKIYVKESARTDAPTDKVEERLKTIPGLDIVLTSNLRTFVSEGEDLDKLKKLIFYGKGELSEKEYEGNTFSEGRLVDEKFAKTLHGILGIATESGELVEALLNNITSNEKVDENTVLKEIDSVNLEEEIGDLFWYIALLCRTYNFDIEKLMQKNIDKLKLRFPNKFSEEKAINRNVEKERVVLEEK